VLNRTLMTCVKTHVGLDAVGGFPRSTRVTRVARTLPIPPVVLCLRVLTKQQHNRPHSVLDWAYQTLKPSQLDDGC